MIPGFQASLKVGIRAKRPIDKALLVMSRPTLEAVP